MLTAEASLDRHFILLLMTSNYLDEAALDELRGAITSLSAMCGADQIMEDQQGPTGMSESCPACGEALSISRPDVTLCERGHRWCR